MKSRPVDYVILFELMKNSKQSDRKIAKLLGVSQATVTRRRAHIERELIDGYTVIPKWKKLGYEIFAFTFVKSNVDILPKEEKSDKEERVKEWMMKHSNVLLAGRGTGLGMNAFMISVHRSYSDFERFMLEARREIGNLALDDRTFLATARGVRPMKPFHMKYLAGDFEQKDA